MADIGPPKASSQVAEKRKSPRKKAILRGKMVSERGAQSIDCTIRDISDTGARIDLAADQIVPAHFVLIDMRNGNAYEAEVKWRMRSQIGMSFVRCISLDGPLSPENRYLKHLWAGSFRGMDANDSAGRSEPLRGTVVKSTPQKSAGQTDVTPEMIGAGVAAYFLWKPAEFPRVYSEPDMVCSVYRAMMRAARNQAGDQTQTELSACAGK
jgi:hypothetical protein